MQEEKIIFSTSYGATCVRHLWFTFYLVSSFFLPEEKAEKIGWKELGSARVNIYQATSGFRICYLKTEFSVISNAPSKKEIPGCIGFQYGELQNLKNSET